MIDIKTQSRSISDARPFLDFYKQHRIAPVSQDISDIKKHFSRRSALYRSLGLIPSYFRDKTLLEFGPGCGHNSIYINSLQPRQYTLVDANPISLDSTKLLMGKYSNDNNNYKIVESSIEKYQSDEVFDIVFCENVIPYQLKPTNFLKHVAGYVATGGVLIITCISSVSLLSELLRHVIRLLIVSQEDSIETKLNKLRPIFSPHLASLNSMSRPIDDWILDAVIQPIVGDLMSMQEAIITLGQEFEIYGSSPQFLTDWRWYKEIYGENKQYNEVAINLANQHIHNLLDYRFTYEAQSIDINSVISGLCDSVFVSMKEYEVTRNLHALRQLNVDLKGLCRIVQGYSSGTAISIENFSTALEYYFKYKRFPEFKEFAPFFGRGTQYLSFTRKK